MWGPSPPAAAVLADVGRDGAALRGRRRASASRSRRGDGEVGVENQGLNRWGMSFVQGKPYEGYVWVRAERPADGRRRLESRDGSRTYARTPLTVEPATEWRRYDFTLPQTPPTRPAGSRSR